MLTNSFDKYQQYAEEQVFNFSPKLEDYSLLAYYSEQQFFGKSNMEFWKFYTKKDSSILLYKFIWNYARELKQAAAVGGIINAQPLIAYANVFLQPKDRKDIGTQVQRIYAKTNWIKEPIYLDGISRKLRIRKRAYHWNLASNNPELQQFHELIEKVDQANYDQYAFQLM